jgi:flagellar protein FlbD
MIKLTKCNGPTFVLNSDLIERIEATPDTVVTLVDGDRYTVTESLEDVIFRVRQHRASILALSHRFNGVASPNLVLVSTDSTSHDGELNHG